MASEQCYCVDKACYFLIKHVQLTDYVDFWNCNCVTEYVVSYKILMFPLESFCQYLSEF